MARKGFQETDSSMGGKRAALTDYKANIDSNQTEPQAGLQWEGKKTSSNEDLPQSLERGLKILQDRVKGLKSRPGVYRMLDVAGKPLYVGKAKNLARRVASYTQLSRLPTRLIRMISETWELEVITTKTDVEALLLESNLIKRYAPRYNILLRDDKSFPYILLTSDHHFAHLKKHRGAHRQLGNYFGPFASAGLVNRTIDALEKAFLLRTCSDHTFSGRTRPCLKYQIKRCSAPCVGKISKSDYNVLVKEAQNFLAGNSRKVADKLSYKMAKASEELDFEQAARLRDRLRALSSIQMAQDVNVQGILQDADVIAISNLEGPACVQVFFYRAGRNYGNRAYFPRHDKQEDSATILTSFLGQFYDDKTPPPLILLSSPIVDQDLVEQALSQKASQKITITNPKRGRKYNLVEAALINANEALERKQAESATQLKLLNSLQDILRLEYFPNRIEVYDNSHTQGTGSIGAMVVAGRDGFIKNAYRKFNIKDQTNFADDFGMVREVFMRRFSRALKEDPNRRKGQWPELVIIDGGKGQLSAAEGALEQLGIRDIPLVAVAKGPERDAGRETLYCGGPLEERQIMLPPRDPVLFFIQRLRDEVHRFAIATHRVRRSKNMIKSDLDLIPGIGTKRKKALLLHFGSAKSVAQASIEDLRKAPGLSNTSAQLVYDWYH